MTASTGKAATGINGVTLHSAFHLSVKSGLKSHEYKKPSDETLHMLRNISVLKSFDNRSSVKSCHAKFVTIWWSLFVVGDFLQLPPVNQKGVFRKPSKGSYIGHSLDGYGKNSNCMSWLRLFGRAVIQILLNYLKGQQTDDDVIQIKALANTDTATWPDEFVRFTVTIT